jgi:hypothetical protein
MSFSSAIAILTTVESDCVSVQLTAWQNGTCGKWRQVASNIQAETALGADAFAALLKSFADELGKGAGTAQDCWVQACRLHHFKGPCVPPPLPQTLGRATTLPDYAKLLSESPSIGLTQAQADALIRKVTLAGNTVSSRDWRILQKARLGRYVIWATFNAANPSQSPFGMLPRTTDAVRTALGLGECSETETLVLLTYGLPTGSLDLYRPTVAEADKYSWFCPHPNATAPYGLTRPLPPNSAGLPAMPEVVHREITGDTLVIPLYLAV